MGVDANMDFYEFTSSIDDIIKGSDIAQIYKDNTEWHGVKRTEYERAIRLMEVTHNINYKGEFVMDHSKFYSSAEQKYRALEALLQDEKKYF